MYSNFVKRITAAKTRPNDSAANAKLIAPTMKRLNADSSVVPNKKDIVKSTTIPDPTAKEDEKIEINILSCAFSAEIALPVSVSEPIIKHRSPSLICFEVKFSWPIHLTKCRQIVPTIKCISTQSSKLLRFNLKIEDDCRFLVRYLTAFQEIKTQ